MKLTYDILSEELAERIDCEVLGEFRDTEAVELPMILQASMEILPEYCYVTKSVRQFKNHYKTKTLFIVCGAVPEDDLAGSDNSIIYFSKPQPVASVVNILQDIFEKYRRWDESLMSLAHKEEPLSALLDESLSIFDNPLFLIDVGFNLIAYTSSILPSASEVERGKVPENWVIRGKEELVRVKDVKEPYSRHLQDDYPRLFINLMEGKNLLGVLSIQASNRDFRSYDGYLIKHLAEVVKATMLRTGAVDWKGRSILENMLSGIIGGQSVDAEEFGRAAVHVGIVMDEQFQCLAVRIPKPSGKEFLQYFAQHLGIQTPLIYISTEDEIDAMILRVSYAEKQKITVLKIIEKGLRSFGIQAGLSDLYEDLLLSRFYYTQARYALENGEASQSNDNLLLFEDCCLDYILYHCTGDLNSEMIWSKGFQKLVEHDRTKFRASYVETLRAYLDNNLNDNRSAVALQITRNSFLSRLERVNALLGENLKDPKVRFRYELAVLLYEKYKNE